MRIAISGTHGIGKTTLVRNLAIRFPALRTIDEQIRKVAEKYPTMNDDCPTYVKDAFQFEGFIEQILEEQRFGDNFISDRSVLDYVAYTEYRGCSESLLLNMEMYALQYAVKYDAIIHAPVPHEHIGGPEDDGFRYTTRNSQLVCASLISRLCGIVGCDHDNVWWLSGNRESWYSEAEGFIRSIYFG